MSIVLTNREKRGAAYAAAIAYGYLLRGPDDLTRKVARMVGFSGLAVELWQWAQERKLFANPDTMNAYFKSGGAVSGVRSDTQAAAIRQKGLVKP